MEMKMTVVLVTSKKGGVGCSTVASHLAAAFAELGKKTLCTDLCFGNPAIDMLLSESESVVYDVGDVLEGRVDPRRVILPIEDIPNLWLLPGSCVITKCPDADALHNFLFTLDETSGCDICVIDCDPEVADILADMANTVLCVSDMSTASLRATANLSFPEETNCRLVINRYSQNESPAKNATTLLEAIDTTGMALGGVFFEEPMLAIDFESGKIGNESYIGMDAPALNTAKRILGVHAPLLSGYCKGKKRKRMLTSMGKRHVGFGY